METDNTFEFKLPGKDEAVTCTTDVLDLDFGFRITIQGITSACVMEVLAALRQPFPENNDFFPEGFVPDEVIVSVSAPPRSGTSRNTILTDNIQPVPDISHIVKRIVTRLAHTFTERRFPETDHEMILLFTPKKGES